MSRLAGGTLSGRRRDPRHQAEINKCLPSPCLPLRVYPTAGRHLGHSLRGWVLPINGPPSPLPLVVISQWGAAAAHGREGSEVMCLLYWPPPCRATWDWLCPKGPSFLETACHSAGVLHIFWTYPMLPHIFVSSPFIQLSSDYPMSMHISCWTPIRNPDQYTSFCQCGN